MSVLSFAETTQLLHPFERPFSAEAGAHMLSRFTFSQGHTHMEVALLSLTPTLILILALTLTLAPTLTLTLTRGCSRPSCRRCSSRGCSRAPVTSLTI